MADICLDSAARNAIERFASELCEIIEGRVKEEVSREILRFAEGVSGRTEAPASRRHRRFVIRPCPVDGCMEKAAPRHQNVCKFHSETLPREKILIARDRANRPGGVWYEMKKSEGS
jgi:hypothetical protein